MLGSNLRPPVVFKQYFNGVEKQKAPICNSLLVFVYACGCSFFDFRCVQKHRFIVRLWYLLVVFVSVTKRLPLMPQNTQKNTRVENANFKTQKERKQDGRAFESPAIQQQ